MIRRFNKTDNKGFTLVELVVVLLILAILSAILVPALLGYIDDAKNKQDLLNAKYCLTAIQTKLTELYGQNSSKLEIGGKNEEHLIIPSKNGKGAENGNGDVNATSYYNNGQYTPNSFADYVINMIEKKDENVSSTNPNDNFDPLVIIFGVGSNTAGSKANLHEKYTVYYLMYQQTVDSTPWFYFNGEWSNTNPRTDSSLMKNKYIPQVGPLKGKKIQYYIISNKTIEKAGLPSSAKAGSAKFWEYVDKY